MKRYILLLLVTITFFSVQKSVSQTPRNLIAGNITKEQLKDVLISYENWDPYPTISDRREWETIPEDLRETYIKEAEKYLGADWQVLPASVFLDFKRKND